MNHSVRNTLLFFILLGAVLRVYQFAFQCPWLEEQYILATSVLDWPSLLYTSIFIDYTPPIHFALAKICFMVFNEWWGIRIPSLIAGILLIPSMYLLGKTYKDETTGVWCAGIASILFPLVYYSQYGRAYALLHLFFTLFLVFYIKEARTGNSGPMMWVFGALCIWTHLYAVIPVAILIACTFRPNWQWISRLLAFAGVTGPLMATMFLSTARTRSIGVGYGDSPLVLLLTTPGEIFGVLFVLLGMFLLVGLFTSDSKSTWPVKNPMIVAVAATILSGFVLSTTTPVFPRYYSATAGLILLLFAADGIATVYRGLPDLYERGSPVLVFSDPKCMSIVAVVVVAILLALQFGDFSVYYTAQKYICTTTLLPT